MIEVDAVIIGGGIVGASAALFLSKAGRRVALVVAHGVQGAAAERLQAVLSAEGAVAEFVAPRVGRVRGADGVDLEATASLENNPGFLYDALAWPDGEEGVATLAQDGHTMESLKDGYRHGKALLLVGAAQTLLDMAGVPTTTPTGDPDPGLVLADGEAGLDAFIAAIVRHRHPERETDPPAV